LPPLTGLAPLTGGYHNTLLRAGELVLRIEEREPESVQWEHELLAWLRPEVPEVPLPLTARDGSTYLVVDGRVVSVLPYVEGDSGAGIAAAELFARVHVRGSAWPGARPRPGRPAYADLDWERNDWWDWSQVAKPPELVRAFEHARAWVASAPELVVTPIHGDPAQQNFVSRDGRIAALLDWEYARLDWPALELAAAADEDPAFVAAYIAAGGPAEPEVLEEGTRIMLLANALYSLTRGGENRDWVDYLLARLRELP
jgi:Ser/Thr protein kinase RdoA (MazF antagonist)